MIGVKVKCIKVMSDLKHAHVFFEHDGFMDTPKIVIPCGDAKDIKPGTEYLITISEACSEGSLQNTCINEVAVDSNCEAKGLWAEVVLKLLSVEGRYVSVAEAIHTANTIYEEYLRK